MQIGPIKLDGNLLLAPMAGVADRPFRQICRRLGASLTISEMISSSQTLRSSSKTRQRLNFAGEAGPISVQIVGAAPRSMAETARHSVARGAQLIDINMGCPAKKVCQKAAGSALLRDPKLVAEILESVIAAVEVPVTLKIRTGWDRGHRNGLQIAKIAEESGVAALTVHGRTRACGFRGHAEYETIRDIKSLVSIPVIANGDIDTPQKAREVFSFTGADGLMIGRGAQGSPWIFRDISYYLEHNQLLPAPSNEWIADLLEEHLQKLYSFYGEYRGVRIARKHIAQYLKQQKLEPSIIRKINKIDCADEQLSVTKAQFVRTDSEKELAA